MIIVQILGIVILPFLLQQVQKYVPWLKAIVLAYVLGIVLGNIFPNSFDSALLKQITGISIILAIPLMLFPSHMKSWLTQPKTLLLAYGLAVFSTTITVIIAWYVFKDKLENISLISGMVAGVYSGGTVNLNAIGLAFDAPEGLSVLLNGFDMTFSAIYLLAIFTFLPKILGLFLPASVKNNTEDNLEISFASLGVKEKVYDTLIGIGLTLIILGIIIGSSYLIFDNENELYIVFGVSGLGLVLSTIKKVRALKSNMISADYLMMIFGFSLGAQANVNEMFSDQSGLIGYFLFTYALMLLIHLLLSKLFRIDVDSFLVSSTAAVFGPPFIGPVTESIKNRSLIGPGIIIALMGNAIGTYLGILIVQIFS